MKKIAMLVLLGSMTAGCGPQKLDVGKCYMTPDSQTLRVLSATPQVVEACVYEPFFFTCAIPTTLRADLIKDFLAVDCPADRE